MKFQNVYLKIFFQQKSPDLQGFYSILGDPDWIRTNDLLLRRQLLYPAELRDQFFIESLQIYNLRSTISKNLLKERK